MPTIWKLTNLTAANDQYTLTYFNEAVYAGAGHDYVWIEPYRWWDTGLTGSHGGPPYDFDPLVPYSPTVYGEGGNDVIIGSDEGDTVSGDTIYGGTGDDFIVTGFGEDTVYAEDDNDTVVATDAWAGDRLDGGNGYDVLELHYNNAIEIRFALNNGTSNVGFTAVNFEQLNYYGSTNAKDVVTGGTNGDSFRTFGGDDEISGHGGNDVIDAGSGKDSVNGGDGHDLIQSGEGADSVIGGTGNDTIEGGGGNDILYGDYAVDYGALVPGNDTIIGGAGADLMYGFGGQDTYVFRAVSESPAVYPSSLSLMPDLRYADAISGFQSGVDRIDLRAIDSDGIASNGNQAFYFHGGDFLGGRGELIEKVYYDRTGSTHVLLGDVNGDKVADFAVGLPGFNGWLTSADILA